MVCADCHGSASAPVIPSHETCRGCHPTASGLGDCGVCHAAGEPIVPADHVPQWLAYHPVDAGWDQDRCTECHTQSDCQECHSGDNVRPRTHALDFAFTHALVARSNEAQCTSCHQDAGFCSSCHLAERILPQNHSRGDWVFGRGGGRHAEEARFDLESCIACPRSRDGRTGVRRLPREVEMRSSVRACTAPNEASVVRETLRRRARCWAAVVVLALSVGAWGCADQRAPAESEVEAHPASWVDPASPDFHGIRVEQRGGATGCTVCHGNQLEGSPRVPSCNECHDGPGGHPYGWVSPDNEPFHGDAVPAEGLAYCQSCHGADYRGGWSAVSCFTCHAGGPSGHPKGWMVRSSPFFHGLAVAAEGFADCRRCHGNDLEGGISGVACSDCHQ